MKTRALSTIVMLFAAFAAGFLGSTVHQAIASGSCSVPYTFSNGTTADANQVNANFSALISCVNNVLPSQMSPTTTGAGTFGGTVPITFPNGIALPSPLPTGQGGTGLTLPSPRATNCLSLTGTWPNTTVGLATAPLPIACGGNGSGSPGIVAGANTTVTGSWPTQTINANPAATPVPWATACPTPNGSGVTCLLPSFETGYSVGCWFGGLGLSGNTGGSGAINATITSMVWTGQSANINARTTAFIGAIPYSITYTGSAGSATSIGAYGGCI